MDKNDLFNAFIAANGFTRSRDDRSGELIFTSKTNLKYSRDDLEQSVAYEAYRDGVVGNRLSTTDAVCDLRIYAEQYKKGQNYRHH